MSHRTPPTPEPHRPPPPSPPQDSHQRHRFDLAQWCVTGSLVIAMIMLVLGALQSLFVLAHRLWGIRPPF